MRRRRTTRRTTTLAALAGTLCTAPMAMAQTGPWYVGLSQTFEHQSNLLRLRDGQTPPPGLSVDDDISSTALIGGIDTRIGRQRLFGNVTLADNRLRRNKSFDNQSYSLALGLDWETAGALSGNLGAGAERRLSTEVRDPAQRTIFERNIETTRRFNVAAGIGLAGPWRLEAGAGRREARYTAELARYNDFDLEYASVATRYRLGGATSVGLGLRRTRTDLPELFRVAFDDPASRARLGLESPSDRSTRDDVDLLVIWEPTGTSRFDARFSRGKTEYEQLRTRDFTGSTGALRYDWNPGGRLQINARLAREAGQEGERTGSAYSRTVDTLRLGADYELTGKTKLNASIGAIRRTLEGAVTDFVPPFFIVTRQARGRDDGTTLSLGLRWQALRSVAVGCSYNRDEFGDNTEPAFGRGYDAEAFRCFAQVVLQ